MPAFTEGAFTNGAFTTQPVITLNQSVTFLYNDSKAGTSSSQDKIEVGTTNINVKLTQEKDMSEENNINDDASFGDTVKITSTVLTPKSSGDEGTYSGFCPTGHPVKHASIKSGLKKCTTCDREFQEGR